MKKSELQKKAVKRPEKCEKAMPGKDEKRAKSQADDHDQAEAGDEQGEGDAPGPGDSVENAAGDDPAVGPDRDDPGGAEIVDVSSVGAVPVSQDVPPQAAPRGRPRLSETEKRLRREQARAAALAERRAAEELARKAIAVQAEAVCRALVGMTDAMVRAFLPPPLTDEEKNALVGAWSPVLAETMGDHVTPAQAALIVTLSILAPRIVLRFAGVQQPVPVMPAPAGHLPA